MNPPFTDAPSPLVPSEASLPRLTAALAHNVNNALTGVIGYLELALQRTEVGTEAAGCVRSGLECAHQAADAVRRIVGCAGRIAATEAPAPQSLLRLAEEAVQRFTREAPFAPPTVVGSSSGEVFVRAGLIGFALDCLLRAVGEAANGREWEMRVADEDGRCTLSIEGPGVGTVPDLRPRLLEPSLMIEIQGGSLELLTAPGQGAALTLSFPCRGAAPMHRGDGPAAAPAPHLPAAFGLLRQAV